MRVFFCNTHKKGPDSNKNNTVGSTFWPGLLPSFADHTLRPHVLRTLMPSRSRNVPRACASLMICSQQSAQANHPALSALQSSREFVQAGSEATVLLSWASEFYLLEARPQRESGLPLSLLRCGCVRIHRGLLSHTRSPPSH